VRRRPPASGGKICKKSNISEKCCNISQNVEKKLTKPTFHKNVVTFLKMLEEVYKREKHCPTFLKILTKNS
jgi:hypothetical protein